jgi:hypothetical protein
MSLDADKAANLFPIGQRCCSGALNRRSRSREDAMCITEGCVISIEACHLENELSAKRGNILVEHAVSLIRARGTNRFRAILVSGSLSNKGSPRSRTRFDLDSDRQSYSKTSWSTCRSSCFQYTSRTTWSSQHQNHETNHCKYEVNVLYRSPQR